MFWYILGALGGVSALSAWQLRKKELDRWLPAYLFGSREHALRWDSGKPCRVFLAVCDHYEPEFQRPPFQESCDRVRAWVNQYPALFAEFADSRGRPPQHTFFFPQDEYKPEYLELLRQLVNQGFGDVDIHLHHDGDTPDQLTEKLASFRDILHNKHGLLRPDPKTGALVYGFIHGNWALCNSRPDRRWCGVNEELTILKQTGCYADFTYPSAPDATQPAQINQIYYAKDRAGKPCGGHQGIPAQVGLNPSDDSLLMIHGPLLLDFSSSWIPRIENGALQQRRGLSWNRMKLWMSAGVHVQGRPDWIFVKIHTHGCNPEIMKTLFAESSRQFHSELAKAGREHPSFQYYYVTAWEMAQLVHQAEAGREEPDFDFLKERSLTPAH